MLSSLHVENYKCLKNISVNLRPLTVLIGPNSSGKSSLLSCLETLGRLMTDDDRFTNVSHSSAILHLKENSFLKSANLPVVLEATSGSMDASYLIAVTNTSETEKVSFCGSEFRRNSPPTTADLAMPTDATGPFAGLMRDYLGAGSLVAALSRHEQAFPCQEEMVQFREELSIGERFFISPKAIRANPELPADSPSEMHNGSLLAPDGGNLLTVISKLQSDFESAPLDLLRKQLRTLIPQITSVAAKVNRADSMTTSLRFLLSNTSGADVSLDSYEVSDGVLYLTAFLAIQAIRPISGVLLLEEPENGLHPSRIEEVMGVLRQLAFPEDPDTAPIQVILTTHSPIVLNCTTPDEVLLFNRSPDGGTNITAMDSDEKIRKLSKDFGTGELWTMFGEERIARGEIE